MADDAPNPLAGKPCPICGKAMVEKYRPFCSSRCADLDLHRWLTGSYAIPLTENDDEDGEEPSLAPATPRER
ncbi:DNA gyrase inhibitor YacG [Ancylobacter sp. WKF20]|uniref:DNA gyrase inhibitor YacG n=1 Tax=Ancylobacter sp. WKF20 TaxID=3039801 RepID=UPI0024342BE1|nr:DNA gyrase inhibitor YacG [Ancylobacter sp. WKF20]WGD30158.1 DNA gyrase inhibitor YacG [Ancylobacter sp. WKF20]